MNILMTFPFVCLNADFSGPVLTRLVFVHPSELEKLFPPKKENVQMPQHAENVYRELDEYFRGLRTDFSVPIQLSGTPFQIRVLKTLRKVPYGETISYAELAKRSDYSGAARAAGSVMRQNPLPIIFPCHRVIRTDGSVGNYAGGTELKNQLLSLEAGFQPFAL